jgi:hypothetical protein
VDIEQPLKSMLRLLVDKIYVVFRNKVFRQSVGIPTGIDCAPLLADLFLCSCEAEFIQKLLEDRKFKIAVFQPYMCI